MRQKSRQLELPVGARGEASCEDWSGEASTAGHESGRSGKDDTRLMERVVESSNVNVALSYFDGLGLPRLAA